MFEERWPPMKDNLSMDTIFNGRQFLMKDHILWKTIFDRRHPHCSALATECDILLWKYRVFIVTGRSCVWLVWRLVGLMPPRSYDPVVMLPLSRKSCLITLHPNLNQDYHSFSIYCGILLLSNQTMLLWFMFLEVVLPSCLIITLITEIFYTFMDRFLVGR